MNNHLNVLAAGRDDVYKAISEERDFQDHKWGTIEQHPHEVGAWLVIIDKLVEDAKHAFVSNRGNYGALDELRKIAAVAVACMEQHGPVHRRTEESMGDRYMRG